MAGNIDRGSARGGDIGLSVTRNELCVGDGRHIVLCCIIAVVSSMIVASFQVGFFSVIRPFDTAPELTLAFTVACAMLFGSRFGAVVGVASAFFADALSLSGASANIVFYLLCGAVVGLFGIPEPRPVKDVWRYFAAVSVSCIAKKLIEAMWVVLTAPSLDVSRLFLRLIIRGSFCTVIFSIIVYIPAVVAFLLYRRSAASKNRF